MISGVSKVWNCLSFQGNAVIWSQKNKPGTWYTSTVMEEFRTKKGAQGYISEKYVGKANKPAYA